MEQSKIIDTLETYQRDLYSSFVRGCGLAPHKYLDLQFMCDHPAMFLGNPVNIIDDMTPGPAMTFECDWNEATILHFYATLLLWPQQHSHLDDRRYCAEHHL